MTSWLVLCHFVECIDEPFGNIYSGNGVFLVLWLRKLIIGLQPAIVEISQLVASNPHILILRIAKALTNQLMASAILGYVAAHVFQKAGGNVIGGVIGAADSGTVCSRVRTIRQFTCENVETSRIHGLT